jgi:alpha-galactosidase
MKPAKIVVVGAGSANFGLNALATLIRSRRLNGSILSLVDINAPGLEMITRLARRLDQEWNAGLTIECSTDVAAVLDGASFVIVSIEVPPREKLWRLDWEIPLRHGVRQPYGENGGAGGFAHTARNVPHVMRIARAMEAQCPDAFLIVFSNPLPRLCRAVTRYTKIKTVGLCHQLKRAYLMAAWALADELEIHVPADLTLRPGPLAAVARSTLAQQGIKRLDIKAAGLNHFTWVLSLRDKETGADLYPLFRERLRRLAPHVAPLSRELMDIFGLFPVPGDEHLSEYLPWLHDAQTRPWEKYGIQLYAWDEAEASREAMWGAVESMAAGRSEVQSLHAVISEGAAELIEGVAGNLNLYQQSVNIPNDGYITNLPHGAVVEVPAVVSADGVRGLGMGALPEPIAELVRRETALADLVVEASVTGSRAVALQALLLDPTINDIGTARRILDDYLSTHAANLPQFNRS